MITVFVVIGAFVLFFLNSGLALLIDGAVSLSNLVGGRRSDTTAESAPEFGDVEIDEIPTATNSAAIIMSGRAHNMKNVYIFVNGNKQDEVSIEKDGTFSTEVSPLTPGDNEIYVEGVTDNNNTKKSSDTYTVVYAESNPSVEISNPPDGLKTPRNEITVDGVVKGGTGTVVVRVNGSPTVVGQGGKFQAFVKLNEGENTITVIVSDDAGNTEEKTVKATYEK